MGFRVRIRDLTGGAEDGIVEAVRHTSASGWFLGVQWHPEDTWATSAQQLAIFRALVSAAAAG